MTSKREMTVAAEPKKLDKAREAFIAPPSPTAEVKKLATTTAAGLKQSLETLQARASRIVLQIPSTLGVIKQHQEVENAKKSTFVELKSQPFNIVTGRKVVLDPNARFNDFLADGKDDFLSEVFKPAAECKQCDENGACESCNEWQKFSRKLAKSEKELKDRETAIQQLQSSLAKAKKDCEDKFASDTMEVTDAKNKNGDIVRLRGALVTAIKMVANAHFENEVRTVQVVGKGETPTNKFKREFAGVVAEIDSKQQSPKQVIFDTKSLESLDTVGLVGKLNAVMGLTKHHEDAREMLKREVGKYLSVGWSLRGYRAQLTKDFDALPPTHELDKIERLVQQHGSLVEFASEQLEKEQRAIDDARKSVDELAREYTDTIEACAQIMAGRVYIDRQRLNKAAAELGVSQAQVMGKAEEKNAVPANSPVVQALDVLETVGSVADAKDSVDAQLADAKAEKERMDAAAASFAEKYQQFQALVTNAKLKYRNDHFYVDKLKRAEELKKTVSARQAAMDVYIARKQLERSLAIIKEAKDVDAVSSAYTVAVSLATTECKSSAGYQQQMNAITGLQKTAGEEKVKVDAEFQNFALSLARFREKVAASAYKDNMLADAKRFEESVRQQQEMRTVPTESNGKNQADQVAGTAEILRDIQKKFEAAKRKEEFVRRINSELEKLGQDIKNAKTKKLDLAKDDAKVVEIKREASLSQPDNIADEKETKNIEEPGSNPFMVAGMADSDSDEELSRGNDSSTQNVTSTSYTIADLGQADWKAIDDKVASLSSELKGEPNSDLSVTLAKLNAQAFVEKHLRAVRFAHDQLVSMDAEIANLNTELESAYATAKETTTEQTSIADLVKRKKVFKEKAQLTRNKIADLDGRRQAIESKLCDVQAAMVLGRSPLGEVAVAGQSDLITGREDELKSVQAFGNRVTTLRDSVTRKSADVTVTIQHEIGDKKEKQMKAEAAKFIAAQQIFRLLVTGICGNVAYLHSLVSFFSSYSKIDGQTVPGSFAQALDILKKISAVNPNGISPLDYKIGDQLSLQEQSLAPTDAKSRKAFYQIFDDLNAMSVHRTGFIGGKLRYGNKPFAGSIRNRDVTEFLSILQLVKSDKLSAATVVEVERRLKLLNAGKLTCSTKQADMPQEFQATEVKQLINGCFINA